jgi:hypothetical protein
VTAQHVGRISVGLATQLLIVAGLLDVLYCRLAVVGHLLGLSAHADELLLVLVVLAAHAEALPRRGHPRGRLNHLKRTTQPQTSPPPCPS